MTTSRPRTVALVLGGGGARGYAHIGVIEVLQQRGYEIVAVAGTSMGALVGGLHAAGTLDDYTEWVTSLTQRDVVRLLDVTVRGPGGIRGEKIFAKVSDLFGQLRIEELPIPFTAVATDLLAGREVWFQQGPIAIATRASIAMPNLVTPIVVDGRLLADGGLLNPVPVAAVTAVQADLTIAVCLAEEHLFGHPAHHQDTSVMPDSDGHHDKGLDFARMLDSDLARTIIGWFHSDSDSDADGASLESWAEDQPVGSDGSSPATPASPTGTGGQPSRKFEVGAAPSDLRTLEVMQLSLEALQGSITRFQLAAHPPDLLIGISRTACRTFDFHRADEMIAVGRRRASKALDHYEARG
ncbi:MAG: patatin-like phospholipase family protein [Nitriliruptoraceae bacterium]